MQKKKNDKALILVVPCDQLINDLQAFHEAIIKGLETASSGGIVTFGIKTSRPETGYGYLETAKSSDDIPKRVLKFVEKPHKELAEKMFKSKNFLWNSGIFLFRVETMINLFKDSLPNTFKLVCDAVDNGYRDLNFYKLEASTWNSCNSVSFDYAIMEKISNIFTVPFLKDWNDLGAWDTVWQNMEQDQNGVALSEQAHAIECKNSLIRSESIDQQIVGIGLDNIVAVAMPDAVLVANMNEVQKVGHAVEMLKSKNVYQSEESPKDMRPWGWFEVLESKEFFKVKKINVNPGAALSLQSHRYRNEHWVIVKGEAKVKIDNQEKTLLSGESIYIPAGTKHRVENEQKEPLIFIEVQTGTSFSEDDIVRYEDLYSRTQMKQ